MPCPFCLAKRQSFFMNKKCHVLFAALFARRRRGPFSHGSFAEQNCAPLRSTQSGKRKMGAKRQSFFMNKKCHLRFPAGKRLSLFCEQKSAKGGQDSKTLKSTKHSGLETSTARSLNLSTFLGSGKITPLKIKNDRLLYVQ